MSPLPWRRPDEATEGSSPSPAREGHVITYTVIQRTTARDLDRVQRAFKRELQLTQGRLTEVVNVEIQPVGIEHVLRWEFNPNEEIEID